jgi:hypothetical protein
MEHTSDIQFIAQMLIKTRSDDQITVEETNRLRQIAREGYSTTPPVPPPGAESPSGHSSTSPEKPGSQM